MSKHDPYSFDPRTAKPLREPLPSEAFERILLVPGLNGSGPEHWQSRWLRSRADCIRVELGDWDAPTCAGWVQRIEEAVISGPGPAVLVGHSRGCLAIACWAAGARQSSVTRVSAAMLVAPPNVGQQGCDLRLLRFAPLPQGPLRVRTLVVSSENDRYASLARSRDLAGNLGAAFANIGRAGHINAESGLGNWAEGQALLATLVRDQS